MAVEKVNFLYTNIGRGHPTYLDGIIDALIRKGEIRLVRGETDVFEVSSAIPRSGWRAASWLYKKGASNPGVSKLYSWIRSENDYNKPGIFMRIMGHDLRKKYMKSPDPVVVAHPTLVGILAGKKNLIYQHGESVAPRESLVNGAETVLVPTKRAGQPFIDLGYSEDAVVVTGLCIEPALVSQAQEAFGMRVDRIESESAITAAFYSSGAEPQEHLDMLSVAVLSAIYEGQNAVIFTRQGGQFYSQVLEALVDKGIPATVIESRDQIPVDSSQALIILSNSRREENIFTAKLFSRFDYFVAPAHERTNWALGLGLPMFILEPSIGPYAPLNRDKLVENGVAEVLDSLRRAGKLGKLTTQLRKNSKLSEMAHAGYGKRDIGGFDKIANYLVDKYTPAPPK